ncbi:MAG: putative 4-hydroxybenzoate polyprenyltransferase [Bacteroidales bacterium]|jgi:4-hydroxybenzoate polyprenyltransferase|nr:putative 4-hydroxybenzoate polyprenyltransferase [Bacteroidales bacterium]
MTVKKYFSLVKFAHTVFAAPFAMIGYFLGAVYAGAGFSWLTFLPVILCMVFARNAAMGFNRYADRLIDAKNPRTGQREIPSGIIRPEAALAFVMVNAVAFVAACRFLNPTVFYLSPVALLVVLGYSLTKKYTALCHFVLGIGLSLAPVGAYLAVTGTFARLPLMFSLVVLLWSGGFDIIYALQDEDFDVRERLHSIPAWLGIRRALIVSSVVHALAGILVVLIGISWNFGICYATGAAIFLFLLLYQHLIVQPDDLSRVNAAFFTSNGIASAVFATFTVLDLFL